VIASKTLYAYDKSTGKIKYTVDNPTAAQAILLRNRGIDCHVDLAGKSIVGSYVSQNTHTEQTIGVRPIRTMNVSLSNTTLVANGTDVVTLFDISPGVTVQIPNDNFKFIATEFDNSIEFTANGISSIDVSKNYIHFVMSGYGYYDGIGKISLMAEE
jgi:hypothetical protein